MLEPFSNLLNPAQLIPDDWTPQSLLLLPVLVALEAVLSADNAIALAAITKGFKDPKLEKQALNIGLTLAYILRMGLIIVAAQIVNQWQFEIAGAVYLLWLVFQHFTSAKEDDEQAPPRFTSLWQAIPVLALTDLAFSLDSVTTAIAISDEIWLVLLGGTIGIIALRFMAGQFMIWLEEYVHLEDAGYVTVSFVGIRLILRVVNESLVPPEWVMVLAIAAVFAWGFSKKRDSEIGETIGSAVSEAIGSEAVEDLTAEKIG
jgi:YkoY family integral membrane protein